MTSRSIAKILVILAFSPTFTRCEGDSRHKSGNPNTSNRKLSPIEGLPGATNGYPDSNQGAMALETACPLISEFVTKSGIRISDLRNIKTDS